MSHKHLKETLATYLLGALVACNNGEIIIDARECREVLKGKRLIMVPLVESNAYKVRLIEDVIDTSGTEVFPEDID